MQHEGTGVLADIEPGTAPLHTAPWEGMASSPDTRPRVLQGPAHTSPLPRSCFPGFTHPPSHITRERLVPLDSLCQSAD